MQKIIIASGPVIVENNQVLLDIQGNDDFWKFCGGKIQENENLTETATRRAKEELGIDIEILDEKPFFFYTTKKLDSGETLDIILVHFLVKRTNDVQPGADVKEFKWIDINNLPTNLGPNIQPALKHFEFLK